MIGRPGRSVALLLAASSCAAGAQQIVETRDLSEAGGAPSITEVIDLAGANIPLNGELRLRGRGDGFAVIGETLWIRGKSFGRQPTVTVAGRPAQVWSRTGDGGMLVRVPAGATAGREQVSVKQEHGTTSLDLTVRRYAGVLAGGHLTWLDLGGEAPSVAGELAVAGARFLRMSPDGRGAYLVGPDALEIFELTAPGRPERTGRVAVGPRIVAVSGAAAASTLALIRDDDLVLIDLASPLSPVAREAVKLPPVVRAGKVQRAELSPDGRLLAFALGEGNRVVLAEVARLGAGDATVVSTLVLDRDTRAPVLVDLAFAHDGRTLWVAAGDTAESKALGPQPTRLHALRVGEGGRRLELARTVAVEAAGEPGRLSTGRTLPLASGAAVRLPPEKATVYLTAGVRGAARSAVFSIGALDAASEVTAAQGPVRMGGIDVTPEGRWLLAAAVQGTRLELLSAPADGRPGTVRSLTLVAGSGELPAEVRIQP
jgi:hypothetical protein